MKRFKILCLMLAMLSALSVFCLTACGETDDDKPVEYEITVDASDVEVDLANVSVCLYGLDGTLVQKQELTGSSAKFQVKKDTYVATLSGVTEDYSFPSVLLKDKNAATIEIEEATISYETDFETMDEIEISSFEFTLFVVPSEGIELDSVFLQVCSEACRPVTLDESWSGSVNINSGEYHIEFYVDNEAVFSEYYTVTLDARFYIIHL